MKAALVLVVALALLVAPRAAWAQANAAPAEPAPPPVEADEPPTATGETDAPLPAATQEAPSAAPADEPESAARAATAGPAIEEAVTLTSVSCEDLASGADSAPGTAETPPSQWTEWEVTGELLDRPATLRAVLDGAMQTHRALTRSARDQLGETLAVLGYQLIGLTSEPTAAGGIKAVLEVAPRPLIRSVSVEMNQSLKEIFKVLLDDEVERRMRLRQGTYLPWSAAGRACEIVREKQRIAEYLHDEGFFDAKVDMSIRLGDRGSARVAVQIQLGDGYHLGRLSIERAGELVLSAKKIRGHFIHQTCVARWFCVGDKRFTAAQHQEDLKNLTKHYQQQLGFPAVRVKSSYDPASSFQRRTKSVDITLRIDERRRIDVVFEGHDPDRVGDAKLRSLLTFNEAGSADDVEANASAQAITTYLQGRGYFAARVTWKRERFSTLDQIAFRISMGASRRVRGVTFVGNRVFSADELTKLIATRPYGQIVRLFGDAPPVTAQQLEDDAANIQRAYRQRGYRDAKLQIFAGPTPEALASVALTMAELQADYASGKMFVQFKIDEGRPTYLGHLEVNLPKASADGGVAKEVDDALCDQVLRLLRDALDAPSVVRRTDPTRCRADANVLYREDRVAQSGDAIRELLQSQARRQASVDLEPQERDPYNVDVRYLLRQLDTRTLGKVLVRGNFRTRRGVIVSELGFKEGAALTGELASAGPGRLRATGLFNRVAVNYIEDGPISHAVVQVEERDDARVRIDFELGQSSLNGFFGSIRPAAPNLLGTGVYAEGSATFGTQLRHYDATLRIPRFLIRRIPPHLAFDAEFNAFYRQQETSRFGELLTKGITVATIRSWQRSKSDDKPARALSAGLRYDFRLRDRQVESIRVAGSDSDQAQLPVTTRTGALGLTFEWEQRITREGNLSPLDPQDGFRLEASVSLASPYLLGQDTFLKFSSSAQVYWPLGRSLLLRTDLRYDQGVPLRGSQVLPEVERFFAGGDSTVRGYDEDRLSTEIIEQGVPPFDGAKQIRVLAAGGNIRAITSVDAQLRISGPLATALFLDAGVVTNDWRATKADDVRPGTGMAVRAVFPFGAVSLEYAIPLRPKLGDDPRGRLHFGFAMRFD